MSSPEPFEQLSCPFVLWMSRETRSNQVRKVKSACHQISLFLFDLSKKREEKMGRQSHKMDFDVTSTSKTGKKRLIGTKVNRKKHVFKHGTQIKMAESPEQSGQFFFCSAHTLILFLILYFPLPLSPVLEICPSAITSQSRPLPGFLCFAKDNQCCSKATLLHLLP